MRGTQMGRGPLCPKCQTQVHSKGMIGGGWRVEGVGGNVLTLRVAYRLDGGVTTEIIVDRQGRVLTVRLLEESEE